MASRSFEFAALAELAPDRLALATSQYPGLRTTTDAADLLADASLDAIVIATPASTHYSLAAAAIRAGKHVLVEKPFCTNAEEAADLAAMAARAGLAACVDHVYTMSPIVQKIQGLMRDGSIGQLTYVDSMRVNLGLFQPDVSVLWDLGAHDFAILDLLIDELPLHIEATGHCHVKPGSPDVAFVTLHYPGNVLAHVNLSWMSPVKMRRLAVGGSRRMMIWDDLLHDEPLKIYDSGIDLRPEESRNRDLPDYRIGDIQSPRLPRPELLGLVLNEFAAVSQGKRQSPIGPERAVRVVKLLSQAQTALDQSLENLRLRRLESPVAGPEQPEPAR